MKNHRMTISLIADRIGVSPRTIMRWEKTGKVSIPKRDYRGWRIYGKEDLEMLKRFKETIFYADK